MPRFAVSLLSLLGLLATGVVPAGAQSRLTAIVRGVQMVHVRGGPGPEHPSLLTLREGAEVEIQSMHDTWAKVRLPDGRTGYVNASFLEMRGTGSGEEPRRFGTTPAAGPPATPTAKSRRTMPAAAAATSTLKAVPRSPTEAAPIATRTPAATPTETPAPGRVDAAPPPRSVEAVPPGAAEPRDDLRADIRRVLELTEEMHRQTIGRHPSEAMPGPTDAPGVASTLALTGAGLVAGFLIGTVYGRRQERSRRTRVRF